MFSVIFANYCEVSHKGELFTKIDSARGGGFIVGKICLVPNIFCFLVTYQTADLLTSFVYSVPHSFIQHFLYIHYVSGTVLDSG